MVDATTGPAAWSFVTSPLFSGAASSIIGAITGGLIGSLVPFLLTVFREKRTFTLGLIAQFDSNDMYKVRTRSWHLCQRLPASRFDAVEVFDAEESDDLWVLIGFFKLIGILLEEKRLNRRLTKRAFGQVFIWWYYAAFEAQLIPIGNRWDLVQPTQYLHDWLKKRASKDEFARWVSEGEKARAAYPIQATRQGVLASAIVTRVEEDPAAQLRDPARQG